MTQERVAARFEASAPGYLAKYQAPASLFHLEKIRRRDLLVQVARELRPEVVLDAGSGPGVVLAAVRECLPAASLVGVDLSSPMLQQARADGLEGIPLIQSLVERLPFAADSFDLVYALGVMDYLQDPSELLRSAQRVLKPGAHFVFTYPNADSVNRSLRKWSRSLFGASRNEVSAVAIASATVDRWIEGHGFELVDRRFITYGNGTVFFPWQATMNRKLERWLGARPIGRHLAWSCLCVARKRPSSSSTVQ